MISTYKEIRQKVYEIFYRKAEVRSSPADSLAQSHEAKTAEKTEEDLSEGRASIFDSMAPGQYKEKWIAHCLSLGLTPAEVERRFGVNQKTAARWFRDYKAPKEPT